VTDVRLWIAASHDAAHRNGGWAFVRKGADIVSRAGGDRRTTRARTILSAFVAALKDLPAGAALAVVAPRADALILHTLLKPPPMAPGDPPAEDLDLRGVLMKALEGKAWTLAVGDPAGPTPAGFVTAWAETASEKAKMGGAFQIAIPKTNLAKVKGL
jgi:hypothetical protein